jgi:type II restriction/modification system DNA methylase subunit YeeA
MPVNPNGKSNTEVVRPWTNGSGIVRRNEDRWVIDFGAEMSETEASLFEAPFGHVAKFVKPTRLQLRRQWHRTKWWLHGDPRPALRRSLQHLARYVATPRVSKHRVFVWAHPIICLDSAAVAIARDDDTTFGILHSRFHEAWSLRLGTWLGVGNDPRYTPTTTFETFPFPESLSPNIPAPAYAADPRAVRIATAAKKLDGLRRIWLNPPDLVRIEPEVAPGYPDRILPKDADAAKKLKVRTLTNLYNQRPQWLADVHEALDRAVAAAYGWPEDISTELALEKLLALNLARAAAKG